MPETEVKETWEKATVHAQVGDIFISKKGVLFPSGLTGQFYRVFKFKYLGSGAWEALKKEPVEVTPKEPGT
jgi:hypothetical protein